MRKLAEKSAKNGFRRNFYPIFLFLHTIYHIHMIVYSFWIIFVLRKSFWVVCTHMAHSYGWYLRIWRNFPKSTLTSTLCMLCLMCAYQFWLLIVSLLRSNWKILTVEIIRKLFFWKIEWEGSKKIDFCAFKTHTQKNETTFIIKMSGIKIQNFFS